jgi:hypothetical protein
VKRTPLKRKSRVNPVSKKRRQRSGKAGKLGIVRLYGTDLESLRRECFERDEYRCQHILKLGRKKVKCLRVVRWEQGHEDSGHMAHIGNKRMYGDVISNVVAKCPNCHLVLEHNPKSVPPKTIEGKKAA